jgi:hypothetical protein
VKQDPKRRRQSNDVRRAKHPPIPISAHSIFDPTVYARARDQSVDIALYFTRDAAMQFPTRLVLCVLDDTLERRGDVSGARDRSTTIVSSAMRRREDARGRKGTHDATSSGAVTKAT